MAGPALSYGLCVSVFGIGQPRSFLLVGDFCELTFLIGSAPAAKVFAAESAYSWPFRGSCGCDQHEHRAVTTSAPRGRTALAGRSPNRSVPTTHALFARQVQRKEQCWPIILNVGASVHEGAAKSQRAAKNCPSILWQLAREKSLVARRSGKKGQFSEVSKEVIQNDICEFESSHPSQAVRLEPR
jgi:hypothetical protein